jgi:creatinine amidohydrolase
VKKLLLFLFLPLLWAQSSDLVEIELMTYPEIYSAIHEKGKTTVLVYNGGTEQRGPHAVLGGHTIMARRTAEAIARRLGNALVAPVLPFSLAGGHLKPEWPGSINIDGDVFKRVNEQVVDSMVINGFKNVILMGDHGGGQKELEELAKRLDAKYGPKAVHVYFCGVVYEKARVDFNEWLKQNHLPVSTHAGIPDTSELMYLGGDAYVRKNKLAAGDGKNGVVGDPRPSTPELGKRVFDMKVDYAVADIQRQIRSQAR